MKLPPDVQFDEKVRLFIWRPHGLIDESAVNKIITILGEMEAGSAEPFNRFSDTSAAEAVDLNFKYIFHISFSAPYLSRSANKKCYFSDDRDTPALQQAARDLDPGLTDQSPHFSRTRRRRGLAESPNRFAAGSRRFKKGRDVGTKSYFPVPAGKSRSTQYRYLNRIVIVPRT